jgi:hypothetical protein
MNAIELLVRSQNSALEMMKSTLADFTDAEMLTRPCSGANHPLWQIGHLCVAETGIGNAIKPGAMPELPAGFKEKFTNDKKTNLVDDPKQLATKQQVVDQFIKTHQAAMALTKTLSESDLDQPSPERFRNFFPTVGDLMALQATHVMMHLGQIQAARRKLGKPILF